MGNALLVAAAALIPLVILMLTSFVKVSVVLSLLRNAIGATDAPSGLVVMGVSLTAFFSRFAHVELSINTVIAAHVTFCIAFVVVVVKARLRTLRPWRSSFCQAVTAGSGSPAEGVGTIAATSLPIRTPSPIRSAAS